ncbi:hypothetical protein ABPG72_006436 [Tetrahymena utriculariae]
MNQDQEQLQKGDNSDERFFLGIELICFMALILYNLKKKIEYESKHHSQRTTDIFKTQFYLWSLKSGISRSLSVFILLFNPLLFSQDFTMVFRRFIYLCPCFVWNHAFVQILQFFCNLYFQGYGGDWQKCFNITYDFSSKIIYGIFGVAVIDGLFRQDYINFFTNGLIIVATHLVITICSLIFFAFNICKMITNLSDYQNMHELVKVKNKTQEFAFVVGLCYGLRISYYYIYAFEIRDDDQSDDSWIIVIDLLLCELISYGYSLYHRIEIGQNTRETHSLEMQNYIPTPFLDSQDVANNT